MTPGGRKGLLGVMQLANCDCERRIRDLEAKMEHLRVFLLSSYRRSNGDASDPMVLTISKQFDALLNEWMAIKRSSKK